jgi:hypothetical protein
MLSVKDVQETIVVAFDFSAACASITSVISVTASVASGTPDPAPSAILSGSPTISGTKVLQAITGGLPGANYDLRCKIAAPDGVSQFVAADVLPVLVY